MAIFTRAQRTISAEIGLGPLGPRLLLLPALALALFLGGAVLMDAAFAGRAIPGLRVGGVEVGALDASGIRARLAREVATPLGSARVRATVDGRSFETTNAELGLVADIDRGVADALRFGRQGSPIARLDAWLDALTGRAALGLPMRAEGAAAAAWTARVAAAVDRPAVDAEIRRTPAGIVTTSSANGLSIDRERLLAMLLAPEAVGDRDLILPPRVVLPAIDDGSSRDALALARAVAGGLEVTAGDRGVVEDAAALRSFIWFELVGAGTAAGEPGAIAPDQRRRYVAWIQEEQVSAWAALVGSALDRPARNATYRVGASGAYEVVPGVDGTRIHQDALVAAVIAELRTGRDEGRRVISAPLTSEQPRFTTADAERYLAQLAPVATFRTAFPVNPARHTNIRIGASLFDGVVVAPGEELSFWSVFGNDPASKGFVPSGAIINGRSDDSVVGGGLCQVSTTLFNAVAHAGYEIVERHAHGYLIERYPIGLDAAVAFPGTDMRWKNDTAYPVLIRSSVSPTSVTFTLVSVPTGRTVTFSAAAQSRWVPVTPELSPDPGHVPGYSVDGRDVVRVRTVTAGDTVVHRDVLFSRYAPVWGGPAPSTAP